MYLIKSLEINVIVFVPNHNLSCWSEMSYELRVSRCSYSRMNDQRQSNTNR